MVDYNPIVKDISCKVTVDIKTLVITRQYSFCGPCFVVSSVINDETGTHETAVFASTDEQGNGGEYAGVYYPPDESVETLIDHHKRVVGNLVSGELFLSKVQKDHNDTL